MTEYVSLHNHSHYSILDALSSPKDLIARAKELGQKAVAITDHGTLSGTWTAHKAAKGSGVKLIVGCEMYFLDDVKKTEQRFRHIILLARNAVGYRNLLSLNKEGFDNSVIFGKRVYPVIDWNLLEKYADGMICLTSCSNGILAQLLMNKQMEDAEKQLMRLVNIFGRDNLGLEVQANTLKRGSNMFNDVIEQVFVNAQIIRLAKKFNLRCVATTNSHYVRKEDAETHDVLLSIGSHQTVYSNFRLKYDCPEFYLKSGDEVKSFFERNYGEYAAELCANSAFFADRCEESEWIDPKFSNPSGKELPSFPVIDEPCYDEFKLWLQNQNDYVRGLSEDKSYLRYRVDLVFNNRMIRDGIPAAKINEYRDRIETEFDVFETLDLSSYMLITADFLDYARKNDISIGYGRGSVGGSYVAYLLDIHEADSIKYDLVFERFHNKLKLATSDIDNDLSPEGRGRVIEYVTNKYGRDHVANVSNINTITPKVYARDVARSCELGGSKDAAVELGNNVAGCIPGDIHSISDALDKLPLFSEYAKKYPQFRDYAQISGKPRAVATHAAGIIISSRPLVGLVPVRRDRDGNFAVEYDKDQAEENGLVKIDFLGLKTLDIIDDTVRMIVANGKPKPVIDVEAYDKETYDLISAGDTYGVFQFGTSGGTMDLCRKIKPKNMEDLALITTLARPASKDIRSDFVSVRDGKKRIKLLHKSLANAFSKSYGFALYDESLLILAKDVAGWDLGDADKLRKLTKEKGKNPAKVAKWKQEFIEGAVKNGLLEADAEEIWVKVVVPFGSYSFNKSHAVLYSMTSFKTAYLKAHYPIEFLMANLMSEVKSGSPDAKPNKDKIKKEIRAHKIQIDPPDLNKSSLSYAMSGDDKLITGLDALKFVSDDAINDIIAKRPFDSFFDFINRIDSKKVRSNTIQALAASGALDSFGIPRKTMYLYCSDYRKKLQVWLKKHDPSKETFVYPWPVEKEWGLPDLYSLEKYYLDEGFCCGIRDAYGKFFQGKDYATVADLRACKDKTPVASIKAQVKSFFEFKVKKDKSKYLGMSMIKAMIEDVNGEQCGLTIFPDSWKNVTDRMKSTKFEEGIALHFSGTVNVYEDELGVILNDLFTFHPIPPLPKDLKAKKVNLKLSKKDRGKEDKPVNPDTAEALFEEFEDELYEEGLIDLDEDDFGDI
jgi:DNA polymerase III subunit alpha